MCDVRVYYHGLTGDTSDLHPHPEGVEGARGGQPFRVYQISDTSPPGSSEEVYVIPRGIHLPAGSLNEIVRVFQVDIHHVAAPSDLIEKVEEDIERGDTRGMYFQNPSDEFR